MKKFILLCFFGILGSGSDAQALTLDEAWEKYTPVPVDSASILPTQPVHYPGRVLGGMSEERLRSFQHQWEYRKQAYELHYDTPVALAAGVYGLALHSRDIDASLPKKKFLNGVLGYHYSVEQVCAWANGTLAAEKIFPAEEITLLGLLLSDGVLTVREGRFAATGLVGHILGAAPGKKRSFVQNLRHERLHILWDEDKNFNQSMLDKWNSLSTQEHSEVKSALSQYAKDNESQLIEEWAVKEAEKQDILR